MLRVLVLLAVVVSGCLPGSGRRSDRSLTPSDSASVALAATAPVDTLALAWTARAPDDDPMPLPTSLGWLDDGRLAVVETQIGSVRFFGADGAYTSRVGLPEQSFPYFAGTTGDTVAVLARGRSEILWLTEAGVVAQRSVADGATAAWAASPAAPVAVRVGGGTNEGPAEIVVQAADGPAQRVALPAAWRASGFVRAQGDTVLALSGYRPVIDRVVDGQADTLALRGFASPQLARSARFLRGDADEPPLLTSSAAVLGDRLFVLNLRADHVRVDVYRAGVLRHVLVSPGPWSLLEHVAFDIAARETNGAVELAILMQRAPGLIQQADAFVALYRWAPNGPAMTTAREGA